MDLEMVLNELSLGTPAPDIITARQWMSQLIQTLRQATTTGVKRVLRTSDKINYFEVAPNYPISRWRNDPEVDREERRFFRTLTNKAPFWNDVAEEFEDQFNLSQVWFEEQEAQGLGFALIIDGLAISLNSDEKWNCSRLQLKLRRFDENNELIDERIKNIHATCKNHVEDHKVWIKTRINSTISNGEELWNRKAELFPSLEFCNSVQQQVQALNNNNLMLIQVSKRLNELEDYCKKWTTGSFDSSKIPTKISPESDTRKNKLKNQLTFQCPNGNKHLFSYHARMTPGTWRLHFYPEAQSRKIIIGYIGVKIQ